MGMIYDLPYKTGFVFKRYIYSNHRNTDFMSVVGKRYPGFRGKSRDKKKTNKKRIYVILK